MISNLGIQYKKKDQRGVSQQPGTQDMYVAAQSLSLPPEMDIPMMTGEEDPMSARPIDEEKTEEKGKKKKKERIHRSEEIKMMSDPNEDNSDSNIDEIQQSMDDLAYDR